MKKGLIIAEGFYPIGSMSLRIRMWAKGFLSNSVAAKILIVAPPPTKISMQNSDHFVHFLHKPQSKNLNQKKFIYLYYRIVGTLRLFFYLRKNKKIDFILISRPNILIGFLLLYFCKKHKVKFFFDKGDENAILIDKKAQTLIDQLAKINHIIFEKYILPKVDNLFVVSSYLEKKYKNKLPHKRIIRSLPTLLDFTEFKMLQNENIFEEKHKNFNVFKSEKIKFFYAGSCERTNGLFHFLEVAADVLKTEPIVFDIIFIFVDGDKSIVEEYCSKLGINNNISFLQPVLPKYMPAIYKYVDILVLPEQGNIIANAGFPGKVGEYLASGKVILSTIFSDLTDYLKHEYNAMLSPINDKTLYKENMIKILYDTNLRKTLGENAIITAKNEFDYKKGMHRFIKEL